MRVVPVFLDCDVAIHRTLVLVAFTVAFVFVVAFP